MQFNNIIPIKALHICEFKLALFKFMCMYVHVNFSSLQGSLSRQTSSSLSSSSLANALISSTQLSPTAIQSLNYREKYFIDDIFPSFDLPPNLGDTTSSSLPSLEEPHSAPELSLHDAWKPGWISDDYSC